MLPADLALFQSPLLPGEPVRFEGRLCDDHLADGHLCAGSHVVGYVEEGVASYVAPNLNWGEDGIAQAKKGNWVPSAWNRARGGGTPLVNEFGNLFSRSEGVLLEVAAGPGGGFFPRMLLAKPACRIIANDLSPAILGLHREQTMRERVGENAMFVAFDACDRVLCPGTVNAISDQLGFGSTPNEDRALAAACEALVPGGLLYSSELACDTDVFRQLPEDVRRQFGLTEGWRDKLRRFGFVIVRHEVWHGPPMDDPEDGGLAKTALSLGITLRKDFDFIVARKPS